MTNGKSIILKINTGKIQFRKVNSKLTSALKWILTLILLAIGQSFVFAQDVNIPDANFKAYLVGNTDINLNGDSEIQLSEANGFDGTIDVCCSNISDLTGIEEFSLITLLSCGVNQLTSLDLTGNLLLESLWCSSNQLTSIDLPSSTALSFIQGEKNQLTTLDLSMVPSLDNFDLSDNLLTSLDLSNNPDLNDVFLVNNRLTSIDLSNNPILASFTCGNNLLTRYVYFLIIRSSLRNLNLRITVCVNCSGQ